MMTWEQLPDHARLWIYAADRQLTDAEVSEAQEALRTFVKQWTAHRRELVAYGDIVDGRFLRLAVDESAAGASGCSIDASVHFVKQLGRRLGVDFFERMTFFVEDEDGWRAYPRDEFAAAYHRGELTGGSRVADPLVDTKAKFEGVFVKPLGESWHARMV